MFDFLYVENEVRDHPRVASILARLPGATVVECERHGEVFNPRSQSFRAQKRRPALILARKHGHRVLPTPRGYGLGSDASFYFSHMLNCVYDCRYCFLQGMYRSAHLVLFVNYEDFIEEIESMIAAANGPAHFFSGYDCDSLALEPLSGFVEAFVPVFGEHPGALLELRTKSTRVERLRTLRPLENVVVAFSLTPDVVGQWLEAGVPSLGRRLETARALQQDGWPVGLRFDPLIWVDEFDRVYDEFFAQVFATLDIERIHSVSLGSFRLPRATYRKLASLYPEEPLFAWGIGESDGVVSYRRELAERLEGFCREKIERSIDAERVFPCGAF